MEQYYVYSHKDPTTHEVVYVGHGKGSRAWIFNWGQSSSNRAPEHNQWCRELMLQGYLPIDFVTVHERGLTKKEACLLEQETVRALLPVFNKPQGVSNLKFTPEKQDAAKALRSLGLSYASIGKQIGLSTMTVFCGLSGRTKNVA